MSSTLTAIIIGVVEGVTEFLPVSSTGHMILVGNMIGFNDEAATVFEVVIQLGAILSVIFLYKERFRHFFTKDGFAIDKGLSVWHVAAGIVPVMGVAYFMHSTIKAYLFSPFTVCIGLVVGGVLMIVAERFSKEDMVEDVDKIDIKQAFYVGLFQLLSLWPGFSRSGSTIAGGLFLGLSRKAAAEFSFIIAVPIMFVACTYDLYKNFAILNADDLGMLAIGFVTAFVTAWLSMVWFIKFLNRSSLTSFAVYRFVLAIFSLWYFYK